MQTNLKTLVFSLVLVVCGLVSAGAYADDDVTILGAWEWKSTGEDEPRPGQVIAVRFEGGEVTFTAGVDGRTISWTLAYTADDGVLTIQPNLGLGEADPTAIKYRIEDGELVLEDERAGGEAMVFVRGGGDGDGE